MRDLPRPRGVRSLALISVGRERNMATESTSQTDPMTAPASPAATTPERPAAGPLARFTCRTRREARSRERNQRDSRPRGSLPSMPRRQQRLSPRHRSSRRLAIGHGAKTTGPDRAAKKSAKRIGRSIVSWPVSAAAAKNEPRARRCRCPTCGSDRRSWKPKSRRP